MDRFWDSSWKAVDPQRVADYIASVDMGEDDLIAALRRHGVSSVCDAGCGCGVYTAKLAANGFSVSGFDVSAQAVGMAQELLGTMALEGALKCASMLDTGYEDGQFDCVLARDVLDHISRADAARAIVELYRIIRPGGVLLLTLDPLDREYETEPHTVNSDGDYVYTAGKWRGMVFHPYTARELRGSLPDDADCDIADENRELTVWIRKH